MDETCELKDIQILFEKILSDNNKLINIEENVNTNTNENSNNNNEWNYLRQSKYLEHDIFNKHGSETSLMRYLYNLESKDLGLNTAMIPLGSCTMKLNAASSMIPITWDITNNIHPFAPLWQTKGYQILFKQMEAWLCDITGFKAISFQPNSGAQGEYAGLLAIKNYHLSNNNNEFKRNVCLIPASAHGTNPASAAMLGMEVIVVKCDNNGNIDINDLKIKAENNKDKLCAIMLTYPSTHGVFEENVKEICDIIHENGGLVYMDGANLQAQVGYCTPNLIGADVCHMNLHKTFCIPHGGGGPGLGPIACNDKLINYLPNHFQCNHNNNNNNNNHSQQLTQQNGTIAGAPWSSASILPIPWMYIRMMGKHGLKQATSIAILNANYIKKQLQNHYSILYVGKNGYCAHEFIIDIRQLKNKYGIKAEDIAKRLMDFGFHAPTMSFPVAETLMVEPTESEPLSELNRFIDAMLHISNEINDIINNKININDSPLRNAPHTKDIIIDDNWDNIYKYTRKQAVAPRPYLEVFH